MTQPIDDRLIIALQNMVEAYVDVRMRYYRPWKYQVVNVTPGPPTVVDVNSTDPLMPNLTNVTIWPDSTGGTSTPPLGATVTVIFENGMSTQPRVVGTDANQIPTSVVLDASTTMTLGQHSGSIAMGPAPQGLAHSTPVTAVNTDISVFITALQTVLSQMVLGYSSLTAGQITAWNAAVTTIQSAITAQNLLIPTTVVTGT